MHYVYFLRSLPIPAERYVGLTGDLRQRVRDHNAGKSSHTAKFKPWDLVTYVGFTNKDRAEKFERYVKSGSGHAFANRHIW